MLLAIQPQQQPGDGHADTHRQLHHHRQQAVAAAGQIVREIFQRQGIHRGEAAGVDHPLQKQDQRQHVIPPGQGAKHKQQADRRQAQGAGDQHPTVAKAVDHLDHDPLHAHAAEHHRDHHQPGVKGGEAEADLQKHRGHKRQHAAADASREAAAEAERESAVAKQVKAKQRPGVAAGVPQVEQQGAEADGHQPRQPGRGNAEPFLAVERQGQGRHSGGQQQKAGEIEAPGLHGVVGHQTEGGDRADDPHRDIDEEDPVPGGVLHQHPAQRRAEQRADLARQGNEGHRRHILIARDDLHHRQAADRHHHRAADPLQHPRHHQLVEGAGLGAKQRSGGKQHDGGEEDIAHPDPVGQPAAGRQHHRHR